MRVSVTSIYTFKIIPCASTGTLGPLVTGLGFDGFREWANYTILAINLKTAHMLKCRILPPIGVCREENGIDNKGLTHCIDWHARHDSNV